MEYTGHPIVQAHEMVMPCESPETGILGYIAIHSTRLGPALGGCRMYPYESRERALNDVLRLAKAMSYKAACAGLALGGGKAVIIGDPRRDKTPALWERFGRCVDALNGRYITAEDVGTTVADMAEVAKATKWVAGLTGDPSPYTARGVLAGMRACVARRLGRGDLRGVRVAVQGLGKVGMALAELLHREGAVLVVADVDAERRRRAEERLGARAVAPEEIMEQDVEVFAPCAMGGVLDEVAAERLRAPVVAGAANNQLSGPEVGWRLQERGILYAPDYVVNAGGLIFCYYEIKGGGEEATLRHVERIAENLQQVFRRAEAEGISTAEAADRLAEACIARGAP